MKVQVLQENLSKALLIANRFVSIRAQLPVLSNILFSAKKNKLIISSTNLENSVSISIGAKTESVGEVTIPSRVITDLVSNLNPGSLLIDVEKERVSIKSGTFKSIISGMNASDFPSIPQTVGSGSVKINSDEISKALSKVIFAVSTDETRPVLTGVLFLLKKNLSYLVSTDGFRLSQKKINLKAKKDKKFIIPKNILSDLMKLSSNADNVDFSHSVKGGQVVFGVGDSVLASRLIEGEFPDFEKILPKKSNYKVNVDKNELLQAVKLASVFARDSANVVKLTIKKDSVLITAESKQAGNQEMGIDAKVVSSIEKTLKNKGDLLEIAFNFRFLEEYLNVVEADDIQMEFSDSNAPGVFSDPKDSDYLHLIMPVKIQS
jgi:DNA polymerase-3 subunit beta